LGNAHYGIGRKEGKTGAAMKFTAATLAPSIAARGPAGEVPQARM
jgi:hypothetical protein